MAIDLCVKILPKTPRREFLISSKRANSSYVSLGDRYIVPGCERSKAQGG